MPPALRILIAYEEAGLYFPQNTEYVSTSNLVKAIAEAHGKRIWMTKIFNPIIKLMCRIKVFNKVFGDLVYDKSMSNYDKADYRIRNFEESIELTELERGYK